MLKTGTTVNRLKFRNDSTLEIEPDFDMGGLQIRSMSLPWAPYLMQTDCDERGKNCHNEGYLIDYTTLAARLFNFTFVSERDPDGDWGVTPKSGPYNLSGTWGGVMGAVINRQYDTSLSAWMWTHDRYGMMSFSTVVKSTGMLLLTPQPPEVDILLYIRPFTDDSWAAIGAVMLVILFCLLAPYLVVAHLESTTGHQESRSFN